MKLSAICVCYGTVDRLQESIACYLAQDFDGEKELVVLNTFPGQKLRGDFPDVKIVNLDERPPSLGDARNLAIREHSTGTHIVTWDSDDLFAKSHLSTFATAFKGGDWVWLGRQWHCANFKIEGESPGSCPVFAYSRLAFDSVGGYPSLTVGEDRALIAKITERFKGMKFFPPLPQYLYSWNTGTYHVSGMGDDKPGMPSAHDRVAEDLKRRISAGVEPTGEVHLNPVLEHNPEQMIAEYLGSQKPKAPTKESVCIVQLGRYGDIVNILPIALHIHNTYAKPYMMVSREFADILEGVSYVEPYPVPLTNAQINEAMKLARDNFKHVIQTQIWGNGFQSPRKCSAYNLESWHHAGFVREFHNPAWLPVFDRRDRQRERKVIEKLSVSGKPLLVVNVTNSHSSPFDGADLLKAIKESFSDRFEVVDLATLKLGRIFDVVGVIEQAAAVVSIDTALLHLAAGTNTPVVAIVNSQPWQGSMCRCRVVAKFIYTEAATNPSAVISRINEAVDYPRKPIHLPQILTPPTRTIFHALEKHTEASQEERKRKARAQCSWQAIYAQNVIPRHLEQFPRNAADVLKDPRRLPYMKDVFRFAMAEAKDDDIIMWTNDDNWLHPGLPEYLRYHVSIWGACSSQRVEFKHHKIPGGHHPVEHYARWGEQHMGRDLFAFTKAWLVKRWQEIPDFILGASDFDLCLAFMIRLENRIYSSRQNLEERIFPAEIPAGYVCHEYHAPFWQKSTNEIAAPSQIWNRGLMRRWASKRMPALAFDEHNRI